MLFDMPLHALNVHGSQACAQDICWRPGGLALTAHALFQAQKVTPLHKGARILDVGCGHGKSTAFLQEQGFLAYGLDCDAKAQAHVFGKATNLPFLAESFQAIFCECVLSIVPDKIKVLQEFWRVGDASNSPTLLILSDMYCHLSHAKEETYSKKQLEELLQQTGWKVNYFEDHSQKLKIFAAQLAWHDICPKQLNAKQYGYGLWIATKEKI